MSARGDWPAVRAIKTGLAPLTLSLVLAAGWLLAAPAGDVRGWLLALVCALLVWRTRVHVLALIATGAVAGVLGWV